MKLPFPYINQVEALNFEISLLLFVKIAIEVTKFAIAINFNIVTTIAVIIVISVTPNEQLEVLTVAAVTTTDASALTIFMKYFSLNQLVIAIE